MWPFTLSGRLSIAVLVGLYPTNKLIERKLILQRQQEAVFLPVGTYAVLTLISQRYSSLKGRFSRVTHPFAALLAPEGTFSLDLHVLGTPPTFILSQDQALHHKILKRFEVFTLESYPHIFRCVHSFISYDISKNPTLTAS